MSFLDTLKKTANSAAQVAAGAADAAVKQTKTLASIGRVKLAIASQEDRLKAAYTELGRLFYRDYTAQAEADMAEYTPWCMKADNARKELAALTQELEALRAEKVTASAPDAAPVSREAPQEDADEEAPQEAPGGEVPQEDTSIFADYDDGSDARTPQEAPNEAAEDPEESQEEPAESQEAPAQEAEEAPQEGIVGTFYLDVSGQDEAE